jgi:RND family efflux transporter MFP subunit
LLSVIILSAAGGLAAWAFWTEPTAERAGASKETAMLVDVREVDRGDYQPEIVAQGTVEPARDIVLRPQVGGKITALDEVFTPGGYVEEGERLLRIQPEDYRHTLAQRKSDLREAESNLAVEQGRHDAAKAEYGRFGEELEPENEALVTREPQLEAAREQVKAAQAAVDQAQLDLSRTSVEAPFDAHILRRDVNVGSQLSAGDSIARLVGLETYWVGVELPLSKMKWVTIEGEDGEGSDVRIRNRQAWPEGTYREGRLFRRVGMLDDETRMVRVLAAIPDPLAREADDKPALTIGEYVETRIDGETLEDVVRLDREYLREDDTVWVMEEGKLRIREAEVVVVDEEYAYIAEGLEDGDRVVTTNLSTVVDGSALRLSADDPDENQEEDGGEGDDE